MSLESKLQTWQNDLLDMSRANNLVYYGTSMRSRGVQLTAGVDGLFKRLTGTQVRPYIIDPEETDDPENCEKRLARLRSRARDAYNDRGTHVLYVAFGMLEWKEAETSEEVIRSPLVLVPVELKREGVLGEFSIVRDVGEEIEINPTLTERLKRDFDIELPSYQQICDAVTEAVDQEARVRVAAPTLPQLLDVLATACGPRIGTVVSEAHLGIFSFQKLVMYQDLKRHTEELAAHPVLRRLGGEWEALRAPSGLYEGRELDRRVHPRESLEILDADSSQQEAIVAAKAGASFVLRGPPGTGKSQTISNIIAECLGMGRNVLFVSEKRAALEVVGQRLGDAGLGEFCLELHSHAADKKQFIADITQALAEADERMIAGRGAADWERVSEAVQQSRDELNRYVSFLHSEHAPLGMSVFAAYAELARLARTPDVDVPIASVAAMTRAQLSDNRQMLEHLLTFHDVLDSYASHPWHDSPIEVYTHELEANIRYSYTQLSAQLDALDEALRALAVPLIDYYERPNFADAVRILQRARIASQSPRPPEAWLAPGVLAQVRPLVADAIERSERYLKLLPAFEPRFEDSALLLDHTALLDALNAGIAPAVAAVPAGRRDPHEIFLADRAVLDDMLRTAESLLPKISAAASELARMCAQPEPRTIGESDDLLASADWLLETPKPPVGWLDRGTYSHERAVALDARDRYTAHARQQALLDTRYTESLLALDIAALDTRFRTMYGSPLRYLRPSYYADIRALRTCQRNDQRQAHGGWQADIFLAQQLRLGGQALEQRRIEYAGTLGQLFDGMQTDWQRVTAAVLWTDRLAIYYPDGLPQEIVRLVTGQPHGLSTLRAQRDRLAELLARWQAIAVDLVRFFTPERLQGDIVDLADAEPGTLSESLSGLHSALDNYWRAADALNACRRDPQVPAPLEWSALCDDLRLAQSITGVLAWFDERRQTLADLLGRYDAGLSTDWTAVRAAIAWTDSFVALYGNALPPEELRLLVSSGGDLETLERVGALAHDGEAALAQIDGQLRFSDSVLPRKALLAPASSLEASAIAALRESVLLRLEHLPDLERWVACQRQRRLCKEHGLGDIVTAGLRERIFPRDLPDRYEKRFYQLWLDSNLRSMPILEKFRGELHDRLIQRFRQDDDRHILLARERLRSTLAGLRRDAVLHASANAMTPLGAAVSALRLEVRKRRHRSIRQIVRQTGLALIRLKPCWMMSPLSISQYVETGEKLFDVVIFDEASQICPEDAICAIFRGAQLIVVGDEKQLPPTRFFARTLADLDDEDEDDEDTSDSGRTPSILEECDAVFHDKRMLRWHYRSRHESLIAFSNAHFYHNELQTFPGPQTEHTDGVRFEYVPDGVYDRGGSRTNRAEARRVVDLAIAQLRHHPEKTLGVVALSGPQQTSIRDEIERRLRTDRTLDAELQRQLGESDDHGFFVKNLESVQGDERDVIILSIGYGKDASGKMYYNFGPVNKEGGERRLNVAVTRAREHVVVVASIDANDLPADMHSVGARTLRNYLEYAEKGPSVLVDQVREMSGGAARSGFDSPFEEAVYNALSARGLDLSTQVGCAGYYIDLAVHDPIHPGRYLLGIECDGATYHSAKTARDRDRLRQRHLEDLGWRIHRIWSRDWVRSPGAEIEKVIRALDEVRRTAPNDASANVPSQEPVAISVPATALTQEGTSRGEPISFVGRSKGSRTERVEHETVLRAEEAHERGDAVSRLPLPSRSAPPRGDGGASPPDPAHHPVPPPTAAATHICEACAFYQFHTASRFYCGHDAAYKLRDPKGRTPGCPAWRRRA